MAIGGADYRDGANERLAEAGILLRQGHFSGSVYLAGRAVEGMLRALVWKADSEFATGKKPLNTGHDLRELLTLASNIGNLSNDPDYISMKTDIQKVARLWHNNMRYLPDRKLRDQCVKIGLIHKRQTLKKVSQDYFDACSWIIRKCEVIWNSKTN
jgi:HEPN domain-containing protein